MSAKGFIDARSFICVWDASLPLFSPGCAVNRKTWVTDRSVPFLPVNPQLSAVRNQGRQKLARFNAREFATLIIDILNDARRRQMGVSPGGRLTLTGAYAWVYRSACVGVSGTVCLIVCERERERERA